MAHDNAESYHPVPSIRRAREKNPIGGAAGGGKTNLTDEHGPVTQPKSKSMTTAPRTLPRTTPKGTLKSTNIPTWRQLTITRTP